MWIPKDKPEYVYKYCSAPKASQILKDLTFFFASVGKLNDLYEFRVRSLYAEDSESKYRVFAKRLVAEGWYESFNDALDQAKLMNTDDIDLTYKAFIEQLSIHCSAAMQNSGVTCFTSERNNQRMWGTYGDNHGGVVLEFTTDSTRSKFASQLMPVIYMDAKAPLCPSELLTEKMALDDWMLGVFFCMKHFHWRDEREWRLLLLADSHQASRDRIIPFERSALTRVFLGPRISDENETAVRAAAEGHESPVPVFKRQIDEELAVEECVGLERIQTFEQLLYWIKR